MLQKLVNILRSPRQIKRLDRTTESLEEEIDFLRSKLDLEQQEFLERFSIERKSRDYLEPYEKNEPLVTVCIATYNRGQLLVDRSISSVLNQTYKNIELIVVGDGCTDSTEKLVAKIRDERLKFINLPERGNYPEDPMLRWMVAGTKPVNHALSIANGDFITHLDDDDEYHESRIEKLTKLIVETQADIVWHPFTRENFQGKWDLKECLQFKKGQITTSSVLYHKWFVNIPWDRYAYRYREPGDWNRFRKFKYLGVKSARHPESLLKHYMERNQAEK